MKFLKKIASNLFKFINANKATLFLLVITIGIIGHYKILFNLFSFKFQLPFFITIISAILIVLMDIVRFSYKGHDWFFSLKKYRISFAILFLTAIFVQLGYLSHVYIWGFGILYPIFMDIFDYLLSKCKEILTLKLLSIYNIFKSIIKIINSISMQSKANMTLGGPDNLLDSKDKLKIGGSLFMEGEGSSSKKRPNSLSEDEGLKSSKRPRLSSPEQASIPKSPIDLGTPGVMDGTQETARYTGTLPEGFSDTHATSLRPKYPEWKKYKGPVVFAVSVDEKGVEYIPCPKQEGAQAVGSSGWILYTRLGDGKNALAVSKLCIKGEVDTMYRGWSDHDSVSNQPAARKFADLLLAAQKNGQYTYYPSMVDNEHERLFLERAGIQKSISDKVIMALRLSK